MILDCERSTVKDHFYFYTIGNYSNRPCRFALLRYKPNLDRQAVISGDSPLGNCVKPTSPFVLFWCRKTAIGEQFRASVARFLFSDTSFNFIQISDQTVRIICGNIGKPIFHATNGGFPAVSMVSPRFNATGIAHCHESQNIFIR